MTQDIITSLIVASASGYGLYKLAALIFPSRRKAVTHCSGCAGCSIQAQLQVHSKRKLVVK